MGNGYPTTQPDDLNSLRAELQRVAARIRELERPTGTQVYDALAQVKALVGSLGSLVNAYLASGFTTGNMTATGGVHAVGTVTADAGVTSVGVYNLDVSTLPGTRRTDWVNQNGQIGYAPSSITKKNLIGPVTIAPADFLACAPVVFEYLGQIDIRDNPDNPNYDPNYVVAHELGHIAEMLVENNCGAFVFTHEDGSPAGINYGEFAAVGFVVVGRDHEDRIAALESNR